jgi:hypothetical protein
MRKREKRGDKQHLRDDAAKQNSAEFRTKGGEFYLPAAE